MNLHLFEGFEDKKNKDKKLSLLEKAAIKTMVLFFKLVLFKINRAKTYGDLKAIAKIVESKFDKLDNDDNGKLPAEEQVELLKKEFTNFD